MKSLFNLARSASVRQEAAPRVELIAYETSYTVKADIREPGLDDVSIWIKERVLTITSEDRTGFTKGAVMLPRLNFFRLTLALPDDADETALSVDCAGRVLHLSFNRRTA
ncbi:MAG: Hsp20/alpha crystallin family protein [Proteobacteria bacterium]|nr:Hsp20/alpha crystallin family protein [Pseudomonadota bacterium]